LVKVWAGCGAGAVLPVAGRYGKGGCVIEEKKLREMLAGMWGWSWESNYQGVRGLSDSASRNARRLFLEK
jgi:hypothetical protein